MSFPVPAMLWPASVRARSAYGALDAPTLARYLEQLMLQGMPYEEVLSAIRLVVYCYRTGHISARIDAAAQASFRHNAWLQMQYMRLRLHDAR